MFYSYRIKGPFVLDVQSIIILKIFFKNTSRPISHIFGSPDKEGREHSKNRVCLITRRHLYFYV